MRAAHQARQSHPPASWQADLTLAFVALIWGTTFVIVKSALADISTLYFLTLRFAVGSFCMLPILVGATGLTRTSLWRGLGSGGFAGIFLWLGYILQTFGLKWTSASHSGFLTSLYIIGVPLVSAVVYRKWPGRFELIGILLAAIGIAFLTKPTGHEAFSLNFGDLLTIGCAVAFALHMVVLGYVAKRERIEAVAIGQIICAALLSATSLVFEAPQVTWNKGVIVAILATGIFATAIAFGLQTWGQKYTSATRAALVFSLEPVFALATAALVGGEPVTTATFLGGGLILGGILCVELKPRKQAGEAH